MDAMTAQAAPNSKSTKVGFIVGKQKDDITLNSVSSKAHYYRLNAYEAPYILVELNGIISQRTKLFLRVKECLETVLCPPHKYLAIVVKTRGPCIPSSCGLQICFSDRRSENLHNNVKK